MSNKLHTIFKAQNLDIDTHFSGLHLIDSNEFVVANHGFISPMMATGKTPHSTFGVLTWAYIKKAVWECL